MIGRNTVAENKKCARFANVARGNGRNVDLGGGTQKSARRIPSKLLGLVALLKHLPAVVARKNMRIPSLVHSRIDTRLLDLLHLAQARPKVGQKYGASFGIQTDRLLFQVDQD